jgi:hypothetical protein
MMASLTWHRDWLAVWLVWQQAWPLALLVMLVSGECWFSTHRSCQAACQGYSHNCYQVNVTNC